MYAQPSLSEHSRSPGSAWGSPLHCGHCRRRPYLQGHQSHIRFGAPPEPGILPASHCQPHSPSCAHLVCRPLPIAQEMWSTPIVRFNEVADNPANQSLVLVPSTAALWTVRRQHRAETLGAGGYVVCCEGR